MKLKDETLGMWLGVLGVAIFAVTLPMTRLATGTTAAPQLSPWFVTLGRAALAGVCSVIFLLATRSPRPQPHQWKPLGMAVLGNAVGYPLLLAYALRVVTASHAAVERGIDLGGKVPVVVFADRDARVGVFDQALRNLDGHRSAGAGCPF